MAEQISPPESQGQPSNSIEKPRGLFALTWATISENATLVIEYLRSGQPDRGREILDSIRVITRETVMLLAAVWLLRWAWLYDKHHPRTLELVTTTPFWYLAALPGAIGLLYHLLQLGPRYRGRKTTVEEYEKFTRKHDEWWRRQHAAGSQPATASKTAPVAELGVTQQADTSHSTTLPNPLSELLSDNLKTYAPSLGAAIWSSLALTLVFSIPAVISSGNRPGGFPAVYTTTSAPPKSETRETKAAKPETRESQAPSTKTKTPKPPAPPEQTPATTPPLKRGTP